jgi:DHA2 family multidrug resistance protein
MLGTLPRAERQTGLKFDMPGFVSMVLWLSTMQIAISNGAKDGWDAPYIIVCFITAAVSFVYLMVRELTTPAPLLDLKVFTSGIYNISTLISMIVGLGLFGSTFLVPVYMGNVLGYSALQIGLVMLPGSLLMGLMMLISGRLSDMIDNRILIGLGLALFAYYLHLQSLADINSPESFYAYALVWRGLGMGMVFSPLSAIAINQMPPRMIPQASGLFNLTRQLAGTIGIAALNTLLTTRSTIHASALGQSMSAQSPATKEFIAHARQLLIERGMAPGKAGLGAFMLLGNALKQQVMVMAFSDLFLLCMAVTLVGLIPIPFLKKPQPKRQAG